MVLITIATIWFRRWHFAGAMTLLVMVFSAFTASSGGQLSHAVAAVDGDDPRVEVDLLFDSATTEAGAHLRVGILFSLDPDWHIYWKNSGDSGFATEVDWRSPDATFGPLQYPAPEVFIESGGMATTYGYVKEILLFSDARVASDAFGSIRVQAEARFLVCKVQCIPGQVRLEATLPIVVAPAPHDSATAALFDRFAARIPRRPGDVGIRVKADYSVDVIRPGKRFEMSITVAPCEASSPDCPTSVRFAAEPSEFSIDAPESIELDRVGTLSHPSGGPGSRLVLRGRVLQGHAVPETIAGVLSLLVDGTPTRVGVTVNLKGSNAATDMASTHPLEPDLSMSEVDHLGISLWVALGFGLLGGLILNLMPCVLPVLALKAYRIIEAGGSGPRAQRKEGAAYMLGVLLSMLALASIVLLLRSVGEAVGWGFQFQEPAFLAFMSALLTVFALNLFGLFEITIAPNSLASLGHRSNGTLRSFFDGTLAVMLATPCSAPFLGTAVGFAFAASPIVVVLVFLSIGVGLALPYLAISYMPGLASKLPRPGVWMENVRMLLGFSLLATVLWLLWIVGGSVGADGLAWLVGLLLAIGLLAWVFGKLQNRSTEGRRGLLAFFAVLLVGILVLGIGSLPTDVEIGNESNSKNRFSIWDAAEVRRVAKSGQVVFVDFTADWCLTCKVNEKMVLSRPEVEEAMRRYGVTHFRADWTRRDNAIFEELQRHGRAGVPLYLVYTAGAPDNPVVLPEILTIDRVVTALDQASRPERERTGEGLVVQ